MYSIRIQKGRYKGKLIQAPVPIKGISNATPSILKEAVFQILDVRIQDKSEFSFFDLCAGSAQMAFEALSQGFGRVHLSEIDQSRFTSILKEVKKYNFNIVLHKKNFLKLIPEILQNQKSVLFLDPPYSYWEEEKCSILDQFFETFSRNLQNGSHGESIEGIIIVQGKYEFFPSENYPWITKLLFREYGNNAITVFEYRFPE